MFKEEWVWLKGVAYNQISGNQLKIECEMGDVKYFIKCQLENLVKEVAIAVGDVGYWSSHYFDNIYYSTQVIWIIDKGERECDNNNSELHTYSFGDLNFFFDAIQHRQEKMHHKIKVVS